MRLNDISMAVAMTSLVSAAKTATPACQRFGGNCEQPMVTPICVMPEQKNCPRSAPYRIVPPTDSQLSVESLASAAVAAASSALYGRDLFDPQADTAEALHDLGDLMHKAGDKVWSHPGASPHKHMVEVAATTTVPGSEQATESPYINIAPATPMTMMHPRGEDPKSTTHKERCWPPLELGLHPGLNFDYGSLPQDLCFRGGGRWGTIHPRGEDPYEHVTQDVKDVIASGVDAVASQAVYTPWVSTFVTVYTNA